jgi:hypothetical protein
VAGEGDLHGRGVLLPEAGGAFYVGEQEGDCACWWAAHSLRILFLTLRTL